MVTSRDPVDSLAVYSLSIKPISTTIGMITYNTIHECRKGGRGRDNYMDDNNTVHGVGMGEGPEADPGGGAKGAIAPPPPFSTSCDIVLCSWATNSVKKLL